MKLLKINKDKAAQYSIDGDEYSLITDISPDNIYMLIRKVVSDEENSVILDNPEECTISNDVQRIIYHDIYNKLQEVIQNRPQILNEINEEIEPIKKKYNI